MLAGGTGVPAAWQDWMFEPKLDGQRLIVTVEGTTARLTNRAGRDATAVYPELGALGPALGGRAVVLDGEVVACDEQGRPDFQRLQRRMHVVRPGPALLAATPATFFAFDVLWLDGELLVALPQVERRRVLDALGLRGPSWQTAPVLEAPPDHLLAACRDLTLEGFMAKRRDARYQPGRRSPAWSKVKYARRREFVVGGWLAGKGTRSSTIGSLALGCYDVEPEHAEAEGRPQRLFYVGQAGSGLTEEVIAVLRRLLEATARPTSPFTSPRPAPGLSFVEPLVVAEVSYNAVTDAGTLRQPSVKGLRTDADPGRVVVDDELAARLVTKGACGGQ